MRSAPMLLIILIYAIILWRPSSSFQDVYIYKSHERQQGKLKHLSRELLLDAQTKIKAVQHYRDQYYKSLQYQLGDIVYEMRDFFKRIVQHYSFTERNIAYASLNHNQWQFRRATADEHHASMKDPLRSGPARDYDESHELLREAQARGRIARASAGRSRAALRLQPRAAVRRAPPAPVRPAKRKNNKWQYVRGYKLV